MLRNLSDGVLENMLILTSRLNLFRMIQSAENIRFFPVLCSPVVEQDEKCGAVCLFQPLKHTEALNLVIFCYKRVFCLTSFAPVAALTYLSLLHFNTNIFTFSSLHFQNGLVTLV